MNRRISFKASCKKSVPSFELRGTSNKDSRNEL